ncbi:PhzF family phenazine biosynthesis protein [Actinomadura roseirufa]|uniref:PhzF family phenazine biosynthesis protein n=1 Tax=Actinomadura roseirufa TaxID=2094049 RepID=UPI0010417987|nr:PhzF family phenazine biosynthesis protein [Actinomadura roseirufa]
MKMLVVDAFTDRPFVGNPASVCLLQEAADPAWMQRVAAEMKHSETAFVRPLAEDDGEDGAGFEVRWFTPLVEVALCGHGTMASAHALYDTGAVEPGEAIRFRTLHRGVLTVTRDPGGVLSMDFPAGPASPVPDIEGLAEALGVEVRWTGRNHEDVLAEVADEAAVRGLAPDIAALGRIDGRIVIVTAVADAGGEHDFVSRVFGAGGLGGDGAEDPVTGSAHCALGPFWAERLGRSDLVGYQASARGGYVRVALRGDRAILSGRAVTVLDGDLRV